MKPGVKVAYCDQTSGRDSLFQKISSHTALSATSSLLNLPIWVLSPATTPTVVRLSSETLHVLDLCPTGVTMSPRPPAKSPPRCVSGALAPASSCSAGCNQITSTQTADKHILMSAAKLGPTLTNTPAKRCAALAFSSVFALYRLVRELSG